MVDGRLNNRITTHGAPRALFALLLAGCQVSVGEEAEMSGATGDPGWTGGDPGASGAPMWPGEEDAADADPGSLAREEEQDEDPAWDPASNDQDEDPAANGPPSGMGMGMAPGPVPGPTMPGAYDPGAACQVTARQAEIVFVTYCGGCHSDPVNPSGGFGTVLDASALVESGKVVEFEPEASIVYMRISNGSMPPPSAQTRPGVLDIAMVEDWIRCGAPEWGRDASTPASFASIDWRLSSVLSDLRAAANPVDRERYRYLDFSALANAGLSDSELDVYRQAAFFLLNSLSRGRNVVLPESIDDSGLLYRLDLRDYLWDADSWNQLEALYPYAVVYDPDSRLFPFDEDTAEQIREETETDIPIIQADWFISHASRPPLYVTLLELPDTLQELEDQLGIDLQENIDTEQVLRAGFADSEPSQNNRVIERHDLGGNRGAFWLSYDFATNEGAQNIFAEPLDFEEDGGEMIFNLDNGLQAYYIADAAGQRLDKAPNNVVQDPMSRDGAVETGISCMTCHQELGQLPKYDEIRAFQLSAGENAQEIEAVLALYPPREELEAAFEEDQYRYQTARALLNVDAVTETTMHQLDNVHLGVLNIEVVSAVVGLTASEVERAIDASPQSFPQEIVTLRSRGGGIQRDAFEDIVGDFVLALGLGEQLRVDESGNRRTSNDVGFARGNLDVGGDEDENVPAESDGNPGSGSGAGSGVGAGVNGTDRPGQPSAANASDNGGGGQ